MNPMERIASIHAVVTVSTKHVTDLTGIVCMGARRDTTVIKVWYFLNVYKLLISENIVCTLKSLFLLILRHR